MKVFLISGKARHGKDTTGNFLQEAYEQKGYKVCRSQISKYLKVYVKDYFEYFCTYINRTIKTITETKRHKYVRVTEYYLDEKTNEWVLKCDDKLSLVKMRRHMFLWWIMRRFIEEDSITEEIKEYHL